MIRGVLFDYGGVMAVGGPGTGLIQRICAVLGLEPVTATTIILPFWRQLTRGALTEHEFWESIAQQTGSVITTEQRHTWDDWWSIHPYPEMVELVKSLKSNKYQVGLLSNIIPNAKAAIEAAGSYAHFDFAVLSCEVGIAKPEPEIYNIALSKFHNLKPEEIVFIDDQKRYIEPAQTAGMQTILAINSEQIMADLQGLGLSF